jgi:flagellar hook-associated protein FlgK
MIDTINTALSGMQTASKTVERAASNIADPSKQDTMIEDIVDIKLAENAYKANAAVIRTASDMQDELLKTFDVEV